jgi:hypothetical protein
MSTRRSGSRRQAQHQGTRFATEPAQLDRIHTTFSIHPVDPVHPVYVVTSLLDPVLQPVRRLRPGR